MRVVAFGTYDVVAHPRVAVLLDGLRTHGIDVVECNEPLGLSTADRVATLRQPWRLPRLAWFVGTRWIRLARRARALDSPDAVVVGFLGHFDVLLARQLFRRAPVVLDHLISAEETALDRGSTKQLIITLLRWLDRLAVRSADLVVVDTEERGAQQSVDRSAVVVTAVGATAEWFEVQRPPEEPGLSEERPLRVVFFGLFTPLQGAPVVGAAIRLLVADPVHITMIGSGQDLAAAVAAAGRSPNVTWRSWVDAEELPSVVAGHDVCLGIFGTGSKSLTVVPNKVFQGMAAGLAIVTSDTPPQRRLLGDAVVLVRPGDPVALADALRALAVNRSRLADLRARAKDHARETMTAHAVTSELVGRLRSMSATRGVG